MSKLRWSKLWWGDWENDPALRLCSLAAQGLWMRLLCIAANANPYGHVLVAGKPPSIAQLAKIVGSQTRQVARLIDELERTGVASRSDRGATAVPPGSIYSRRMVRDFAQHETNKRAGKRGGNPALKKVQSQKLNGESDKPPLNYPLNAEEEAESEVEVDPPFPPKTKTRPAKPAKEDDGWTDLATTRRNRCA